ncbi:type I-E CRISPR-associated protein Cse1/CasA [Streptomyces sp. GbtcB6]|uniref:type I-E CRISPR-associated protein Cse1/CasA n=1 Tax=Streptomyces sp. GbtcB6 TaxID=2824751 RepID=UPI0027E4D014|nr:type I-E CRISPR-associated protein Cse1/CasA [Streptomyces sp. GbtcB6]
MGFNLLTEPWLPAVRMDGARQEISLAQALREAASYRRLAGSSPTMTAALHRLLLALAHRVYQPLDAARWAQLWQAQTDGGLPAAELAAYQEKWHSRFDLFDPDMPFFQCPALDNAPGSTAKLVAGWAAGSNRTLFDHTTADQRPVLAAAHAARWLVTVQAYDTSGTKQPYRKERTAEGGLGNRFGCVLVEGGSLHETLLLNMQRYQPDDELPARTTGRDRPVWEAEQPPDPEPDARSPLGWTDLLTWPSRRILLSTSTSSKAPEVDGVVLTPGTRLEGDLVEWEAMAAYRRPWLRGGKQGDLRAVTLDELRGVWRHSQELLLASDKRWWNTWRAARYAKGPLPAQEPERRRPAALDHIAELVEDGHIPEDTVYTLRIFGQQLGDQGGDTYAWYEEAVPAPVALMRADSARIGRILGYAVSLANDLGEQLKLMERQYAADFHRQLSKDQEKKSSELEILYWPQLAPPFAAFLRELGQALLHGTSETEPAERWGQAVSDLADKTAWQWLQGAPRRDRLLLTASAHFDDFQLARQKLQNIFRGGLARYSVPPLEDA